MASCDLSENKITDESKLRSQGHLKDPEVQPFLCEVYILSASENKKASCDLCENKITDESKLRSQGNLKDSEIEPFLCELCEKQFPKTTGTSNVTKQKRTNSVKVKTTGILGKQSQKSFIHSSNSKKLKRAKSDKESYSSVDDFDDLNFKCFLDTETTAEKVGKNTQKQLEHVGHDSSRKKHVCNECGKYCTSLYHLKRHSEIHRDHIVPKNSKHSVDRESTAKYKDAYNGHNTQIKREVQDDSSSTIEDDDQNSEIKREVQDDSSSTKEDDDQNSEMRTKDEWMNAMTDAVCAVTEKGMSAARASRLYGVGRTALSSRINGKIGVDSIGRGRKPMFTSEQEYRFGQHLERMRGFGYEYTRLETLAMATEYAHELGIRQTEEVMTLGWYRRFLKRWPGLKLVNYKPMDIYRAKAATQENVLKYFENLQACLQKYNLTDKPRFIFNCDEKAFLPQHAPPASPKGVASKKKKLIYSVTPPRGSTTTVIGCGSAVGQSVPPFFVFNQRARIGDLLDLATRHAPGSTGAVSDNGWSNTAVFTRFMKEHFYKHLVRDDISQPVIMLYDGHKSHISLNLLHWADEKNIKLFVLPAHTSHFLQPLDVGCFSRVESKFEALKHAHMQYNRSDMLDVTDVVELGCQAYNQGLTRSNLQAAFRKTGIYPLAGLGAIDRTYIDQAELYLTATKHEDP